MANVRIRWNYGALREIRMSGMGLVDQELERIAGEANSMSSAGGFDWESHESGGAGRARGTVFTDTPRAMVVNQRDNILIRAVGGGS